MAKKGGESSKGLNMDNLFHVTKTLGSKSILDFMDRKGMIPEEINDAKGLDADVDAVVSEVVAEDEPQDAGSGDSVDTPERATVHEVEPIQKVQKPISLKAKPKGVTPLSENSEKLKDLLIPDKGAKKAGKTKRARIAVFLHKRFTLMQEYWKSKEVSISLQQLHENALDEYFQTHATEFKEMQREVLKAREQFDF